LFYSNNVIWAGIRAAIFIVYAAYDKNLNLKPEVYNPYAIMIEIKIPSPGESITEVELANWLVKEGDYVEKDQEIAEIESDKATLPLVAETNGRIELLVKEGETVTVGETACRIDDSVKSPQNPPKAGHQDSKKQEKQPHPEQKDISRDDHKAEEKPGIATAKEKTADHNPAENDPENVAYQQPGKATEADQSEHKYEEEEENKGKIKVTPLAQKKMRIYNLSMEEVLKGLRRITSEDVEMAKDAIESGGYSQKETWHTPPFLRKSERKKISRLRQKLSERLVAVKNETAMLTTFNEADMSQVINMRQKYQQHFQEKHRIKLGYMSFFTKAVTKALEAYPNVNAMIADKEFVYPKYADVGIAVQTPKGLMVPVIRNAESLGLAEIEKKIKAFAEKAQNNRIAIEDLEGGTFSITNGGIFGSLLSTPILNPPQSAILGMHTIQERPVAIEGKVEIRPMMYLALSYDHRIIDGKESVSFLVMVKNLIENPQTMLFDGKDPEKILLGLSD